MEYKLTYQEPVIKVNHYLATGGPWTPTQAVHYRTNEIHFRRRNERAAKNFVRSFLKKGVVECGGQTKKRECWELTKVVMGYHGRLVK